MVLRSGALALLLASAAIGAAQAQVSIREKLADKSQAKSDKLDEKGFTFSAIGPSGGPRPLLFGFALECTQCGPIGRPIGAGRFGAGQRGVGRGLATWHYTEFPRIAAVKEGSPADRAGIRQGDILLSVDGLSLLTDEGAGQFMRLRVGDEVTLTLERAGKSYTTSLVLGRIFGRPDGPSTPFAPEPPHFSTQVGGTAVEITSDVPVVSSTEANGTTTLRVGNTVIRLKPQPQKTP